MLTWHALQRDRPKGSDQHLWIPPHRGLRSVPHVSLHLKSLIPDRPPSPRLAGIFTATPWPRLCTEACYSSRLGKLYIRGHQKAPPVPVDQGTYRIRCGKLRGRRGRRCALPGTLRAAARMAVMQARCSRQDCSTRASGVRITHVLTQPAPLRRRQWAFSHLHRPLPVQRHAAAAPCTAVPRSGVWRGATPMMLHGPATACCSAQTALHTCTQSHIHGRRQLCQSWCRRRRGPRARASGSSRRGGGAGSLQQPAPVRGD